MDHERKPYGRISSVGSASEVAFPVRSSQPKSHGDRASYREPRFTGTLRRCQRPPARRADSTSMCQLPCCRHPGHSRNDDCRHYKCG